ncbi:MAG: hotdog fold thioesterase [Candidatus Tectomicrobia bacterium]|uniref:Hotdog fold thioesterase n=1 Tax=Tectimicrobiota bacterium TaxID=2528274 RepID=A0A932LYW0_UNCTE|nr:hotdog fold thioesterase [Candidatus Tectomicrobia bacterium]
MGAESLDLLREKLQQDPFARALGIRLLLLEKGLARLEMPLGEHTRNFLGMTHGAAIFALADQAFAAACNSHGERSVAFNVTISFLAPPRGDRLVAEARELSRSKNVGVYHIQVNDADGSAVAEVQGLAYRRSERT